MPYQQIYYLNGPDLLTSTAIFLDVAQTICAPDGYYSDGVNVRLLSGCSLLPTQLCDTCGEDCFLVEGRPTPPFTQSGGAGVYKVPINLTTNTGAVIIEFSPGTTLDGIMVEYDGNLYDTLSAQNYLGNTIFSLTVPPVYFGNSATCPAPQTVVVPEFLWNGSNFSLTPNNVPVNMVVQQVVNTGISSPGTAIMVVPKPNAAPQLLELTIYTLCAPSDWSFAVRCPQLLQECFRTPVGDPLVVCDALPTETFYVAHVNGSAGQLDLNDWVFTDPYGQNYLPDGWYTAPIHLQNVGNSDFEVANGIVVGFDTTCSATTLNVTGRDLYTPAPGCVSGGIINSTISIEWQPLAQNIYADTYPPTIPSVNVDNGVYTVYLTLDFDAIVGCQNLQVLLTLTDSLGSMVNSQVFTPTPFGQILYSYQFSVSPANGPYTLDIVLYPI